MMIGLFMLVGQQGMFGQVIGTPTGRNGYEEYVRAAEICSSPLAKALTQWLPNTNYGDDPSDESESVAERQIRAILVQLQGKTPLQVERLALEKFEPVLGLIHQGDSKPVFSPRSKIGPDTLFPEFAGMKQVSKISALCCRAMLADGRSSQAMQTEIDQLQMASNIEMDLLIGQLVGIACQSIALASINENIDRFSERDWQRLLEASASWPQKSKLLNSLQGEAKSELNAFDLVADSPATDDVASALSGSADDSTFLASINKLDSNQKATLRSQIADELDRWLGQVSDLLAQPESRWSQLPPQPTTTAAQRFISCVSPTFSNCFLAEAKNRTQVRLLRIHAKIQVYYWNWHRLPKGLSEVLTPAELHDPFADQDFQIEFSGNGYRLFSQGNTDTGEIELKYHRMPSPDSPDSGTPLI